MLRRTVRRSRDGRYSIRLSEEERTLLQALGTELLEQLEAEEHPGVQRLFPSAHQGDPVSDAEFHLRRHDDLMAGRRAAISTFIETVADETIDEEQLQTWLTALNDLRIVLGTQLDVSEEMDAIVPPDPRAAEYAVYEYLGGLLGEAVDAAFGGLR